MNKSKLLNFFKKTISHYNALPVIVQRGVIAFISCFIIGIIYDFIFPLHTNVSYSQVVFDHKGEIIGAYLTPDHKWRLQALPHEISPIVKKIILEKEDRYFYYHFGVNPIAIFRALGSNILHKRRTSGASTISMQVVRLLSPRPRTYTNKIIEIIKAIQLECHLSKDEILNLYLNLLPYGGNIEGIKSASLLYFQRPPGQLSLAQATTLAIVPNRPTSLNLHKKGMQLISARNLWLKKLKKKKIFNTLLIQNAINEPLDAQRIPIPNTAPHWTNRLTQNSPLQNHIISTLDSRTQALVELKAQNYINRISHLDISNIAIMVVENKSRKIRAYLGSKSYRDYQSLGQNDGVKMIRSPGSTLKPFLFANALEKGLITPLLKLTDIPLELNGYQPENYDLKYRGLVSATFALSNSLNIPAVNLLQQIGVSNFAGWLGKWGLKRINKEQNKLGLSMILGGCGASLEQLVTAYVALANKGRSAPLIEVENSAALPASRKPNPLIKEQKIIDEGTAFLIAEMLSQVSRPDIPTEFENSFKLPKIAWKTGTSFANRDAWVIGYNPEYTIGIWIGNFDGKSAPALSGSKIATPLLFDIFNNLTQNTKWFNCPKSISYQPICSQTGLPPNDYCQNTINDAFLYNVTPPPVCQHQKWVWINSKLNISYCANCLPNIPAEQKAYPNLSPELLAYYQNNNISVELPPPHNPECYLQNTDSKLKIISPTHQAKYILDAKKPNSYIQLKVVINNPNQNIHWFIDGTFYKTVSALQTLEWKLKRGKHSVSASDANGNIDRISFIVE